MSELGIYLPACYPSRAAFLDAVRVCRDSGIDFLEVGFPFSDPVADGEVIERASQDVLTRTTMAGVIESFREASSIFGKPLYIMTYANIVYCGGIRRFIEKVGPCAGLILADLPLREVRRFEKEAKGINIIRFLTPESRQEDVEAALDGAKGFIYFVSKRGTTGGGFGLDGVTLEKIAAVRGRGVPVYLGFGIRDRHDLSAAFKTADGAIIGTQAVSALGQGIDAFARFIASLR